MSTKLVNTIFISEKELEKQIHEKYTECVKIVEKLLENRFIFMENRNVFFDRDITAFFPKFNKFDNMLMNTNTSIKEINDALTNHFNNGLQWEVINWDEKVRIFTDDVTFPSKGMTNSRISYKNNPDDNRSIVKMKTSIVYHDLDGTTISEDKGTPIAICRLNGENSGKVPAAKVLWLWLQNYVVPEGMSTEEKGKYTELLGLDLSQYGTLTLTKNETRLDMMTNYFKRGNFEISKEGVIEKLLNEDMERAIIPKYSIKRLEDINEGHWSLWNPKEKEGTVEVSFDKKLVAKDPASSIVEGIVGIDFGTKSTVVAYQKDKIHTLPMRIRTEEIDKKIEKDHYENPTVMEFKNLEDFMKDYRKEDGRPHTKWKDLTVSHTAANSFKEREESRDYTSFIYELKQWAGCKKKRLKIVDQMGYLQEINPYPELKAGDLDPIELYAYYLGLNINNMHRGIYMNYSLSFPVTYEIDIRNRILESFTRGLRKSLPQSLLDNKEAMKRFSVQMGTSEPAAYAVTALKRYGFEPEGEDKFLYGIFDFGGGTTDFDFGIWRESDGLKESRYDYVIDHFGAGGDRYLGGENLLELMAFEVFKKNADLLRQHHITFTLPNECKEFLGSETLLTVSGESSMNMKIMMEELRDFWEKGKANEVIAKEGISLYNRNGEQLKNFKLDIDFNELEMVLKNRIKRGVENFFHSLRNAFENYQFTKAEKIHIFLAGNSSKSPIVMEMFEEVISHMIEDNKELRDEAFEIFPALGTAQSYAKLRERGIEVDEADMEAPTGKTGVAFGIIETRKGGNILIVDHNTQGENKYDIFFKHYLGRNRKSKFRVMFDRATEYNKWVGFIDAAEREFEIFYTNEPSATSNTLAIDSNSIKVKRLTLDATDENALVFVRAVSPNDIEYVVAHEDTVHEGEYLGEVQRLYLD